MTEMLAPVETAVLQSTDGTESYQLRSTNTYRLGRGSQVEIAVRGSSVSRVHALVVFDGKRWILQDLSTFGTKVNGRPASNRYPLQAGDVISLGEVSEWVFLPGPPESPAGLEVSRIRPMSESGIFQVLPVGKPVIIGSSESTQALRHQCGRVGVSHGAVMIRGERGTGRRLIARSLHARGTKAFTEIRFVRASALSPDAFQQLAQLIQQRGDQIGTVIIDEFLELPAVTQPLLLKFLRDTTDVGPRWIALTTGDPEAAVDSGRFLSDLCLKLGLIQIFVDPLRARLDDIPELASYFARECAESLGLPFRDFSPAAVDLLKRYHWPANLAELRNVVERAVMLATGEVLERASFQAGFGDRLREEFPYAGFDLEQVEAAHIKATLLAMDWVKSHVAKTLKIERSTLDRKIARYGILRPGTRTDTDPEMEALDI
jgi:transcriptional regulator of acetoin/glycerol metabolism